MSVIGAAIVGGVSAAGSIAGSVISGNAARDGAQKQADAAKYASDLQHQQYEETRTDQQPWRQAGAQALGQMQDPGFQHDFSMSDFQADPGYQFRMQQGMNALQSSAAARGGALGGNTLQALTNYSQDAASQEYQNAYNRFNNNQSQRFNRLASLAGIGQTANAQVGAAGQNAANQIGANTIGAANAQAAAGMSQANSWSNTLGNIGNTGLQMAYMNKYAPPSPQSTPDSSGGGGGYSLGNFSGGGNMFDGPNPYT